MRHLLLLAGLAIALIFGVTRLLNSGEVVVVTTRAEDGSTPARQTSKTLASRSLGAAAALCWRRFRGDRRRGVS